MYTLNIYSMVKDRNIKVDFIEKHGFSRTCLSYKEKIYIPSIHKRNPIDFYIYFSIKIATTHKNSK